MPPKQRPNAFVFDERFPERRLSHGQLAARGLPVYEVTPTPTLVAPQHALEAAMAVRNRVQGQLLEGDAIAAGDDTGEGGTREEGLSMYISFRFGLKQIVAYRGARWQVVARRYQEGTVSRFHEYALALVQQGWPSHHVVWAYEPDIEEVA